MLSWAHKFNKAFLPNDNLLTPYNDISKNQSSPIFILLGATTILLHKLNIAEQRSTVFI